VSCVKTAEPIDLPFGLRTRVGRRKHKINRIRHVAPIWPHGRAHWRRMANTIQSSVCGGDAALSNYFDRLLLLGRITVGLLWPIFTDRVAWSIGRSVTLVSPTKRLNRSRCRLGCGLVWAKEAQVQSYSPSCASVPL